MFNSTSATQSQSLFNNVISDIEMGPAPFSGASAGPESHQQIVGELVFGKFVKEEDEDGSPLLLEEITPASATSTLGDVVDDFFLNDDNSTPMFEFEAAGSSGQWTSLFDNDIPITQEDVKLANELTAEIEREDEKKTEVSPEVSKESFLPTPTIEEGKLTKAKHGRKVSKVDHLGVITYNRKNRSVPLSPVITDSDDPVAMKRARNTEAARRSRARKLMRMNQLEEKVEELLDRNFQLENEVKRLTSLLNK